MQIPRIDPKNALGLVDKVVGLGKEIAGSLTGQDRLKKAAAKKTAAKKTAAKKTGGRKKAA